MNTALDKRQFGPGLSSRGPRPESARNSRGKSQRPESTSCWSPDGIGGPLKFSDLASAGTGPQGILPNEKCSLPKAEIVAVLRDEGERWCDWVEKLPEARAVEIVTRGGGGPGGKSRFEMLIDSKEHEMHHRAQLMVIERLLGIVPHLTRNRQRPQESAQRSTT